MNVARFPDRPIRVWKAYRPHPGALGYPLYLPSGMESIESYLRSGNVSGAINELERNAALGSTPARTVLGFLHLQGALPTGVNLDRAAELLEEPVACGDAYAMYVRALLYMLREKQAPPAMRLLLDSAAQGFSPSQVTIADFLASDYPGKPGDIDKRAALLHQGRENGTSSSTSESCLDLSKPSESDQACRSLDCASILFWMALSRHACGLLF